MEEADDDFFTDDLLTEKKKGKKRKADGKKKGNRKELELAKILNQRFGGGFSRSVGSGNRWGQVSYLPKHAQDVFAGDLIVPQGFKWALESKGGYSDIDLNSVFVGGSKELDGFLDQVTKDAERCGAGQCCVGSGTGSRGWRSCRRRNWKGIPSSTGLSTRNGRRWHWKSC